jgi:myo-inositol-1(or 4)-monophosphatase
MTNADLDLIRAAALAAAERAQVVRRAGLTTVQKPDGTPVTNADIEVDTLLREALTAARPDYGWLSEETADDPDRLMRQRLFVVDPIDGTSAYLKGRSHWGVSIGLVEDGRPIAGVFCAPDMGETYEAVLGGGALFNGEAMRPTDVDAIEDCALLADAPMMQHPAWSPPWPPMRIENRASVAYRMCLVARGAFDATLALSSKSEWDLAAADLIAREAGCLVTSHRGRALAYNKPKPTFRSLVCAGPALHRLILERVAPIDLPGSTDAD